MIIVAILSVMPDKILIMVPAYNEAGSILQVIKSLKLNSTIWDILIINDASNDKTSELAKSMKGIHVIDLPFNLGVGGCIQTGFKFARNYGYDLAIQFDGDGQHKAEEILKLISLIQNEGVDVAIGSRFLKKHSGFKSTWSRRLGINIFRLLIYFLLRITITDSTSGFRAYNKRAINFLAENYPVDYPEPEAIILLAHNGFRLKEVHTVMRERMGGSSSITIFNSPYYMTKVMLGMVMTALRPKLVSSRQ
jgi:glycosyltransferase involved in cell wall biosynthesis